VLKWLPAYLRWNRSAFATTPFAPFSIDCRIEDPANPTHPRHELCASYLGSGHRLEVYDEDGSLTLINTTSDYMRGFERRQARRPAMALALIDVDDSVDRAFVTDGRIAPVSRHAADFLDAISHAKSGWPGFAEGYRVQTLLDIARRAQARIHGKTA
jgi:predicted dehydrogenase